MLGDSSANLNELFELASNHVRTIYSKICDKDLLYLYSRYKQATEGSCNTTRPGFFDFQGKQKWDAWKELGDLSKDDSKQEYIDKVTELDPSWQNSDSSSKAKSGLGLGVSRFAEQDEQIKDEDKSIFDFCQDGNLEKISELLNNTNINDVDEHGMSLLHWSCDRGHVEIAKYLIDHGANINLQDNELQTPLHYAINHFGVTKLLLKNDALRNIKDINDCTPFDVADQDDIKTLLTTT